MIDVEKTVIGTMLIYPSESEKVYVTLAPKMFEYDKAKAVFSLCMQLHKQKIPVEVATLIGKLGDEYKQFIVECAESYYNIGSLDTYIEMVQDGWRDRTINAKLEELVYSGLTPDDKLDEISKLMREQEKIIKYRNITTRNTLDEAIISCLQWMQRPTTSIKTGWGTLDRITGGLERKGCTVIVARPGNGKSTLGIQMATQMSFDKSIYYQSMEMPKEQIAVNILSRASGVDSNLMRDHNVTGEAAERIALASDSLYTKHHLIIDDSEHARLEDIERNIERDKPDVLFIDHIGLIEASNARVQRNEQLSEITRTLKQLAMKHNIAIVEMVQAGRSSEGKKITMADMFGSASIEHDADMILAINVLDDEQDGLVPIEVDVVKNRHGATGTVNMYWFKSTHDMREKHEN